LDVTEPAINPDTGYPVLSIGYPILKGDEFMGFAAANITVGTLSKYLDAHRVSPNGKMLVIDQTGHVIAHPDPSKGVRSANGKLVVATVADLDDALKRLATFKPRQGQLLQHRYFGGLTLEESATATGVSLATAKRELRFARAWLALEIKGAASQPVTTVTV